MLREVDYPVRDGKPLGETDLHRDEIVAAIEVLREHFRGQLIYVSGNNFIYYAEGYPKVVVSPDAYVVRGVEHRQRDIFKVWEEGGNKPCFVLEVTSKKTRREDLGSKMSRYRDDLCVPEYFLFDPRGDWIPEQLRGFRLTSTGVYEPIARDAAGRLESRELGLWLGVQARHLRLFLPGAAGPLPTLAERAEQERQRAEHERQRADALAEEVRRLRAELGRPGS